MWKEGVDVADIVRHAGTTIKLALDIQTEAGQVADITGATLEFKAWPRGGTLAISKTATLTDPSNGVAVVILDPANTAGRQGMFEYVLELTLANSEKYVVATGTLELKLKR